MTLSPYILFFLLSLPIVAPAQLHLGAKIYTVAQTSGDPLIFIDSISAPGSDLQTIDPNDIEAIFIYKDAEHHRQFGRGVNNGIIFIETKKFTKKRYWTFLASQSPEYLKTVPGPDADTNVVYILDGIPLEKNTGGELSKLNTTTLGDIQVIDRKSLVANFSITGKEYGVLICTRRMTPGL